MRIIVAIVAAAVVWSAEAWACKPVRGYRIPFNFELVKEADLIVLARVKNGPSHFDVQALAPPAAPNSNLTPPQQGVTLIPIQVLKGRLPPGELRVVGVTSDFTHFGKPAPLVVTKLNEAHPSSYEGSCVREVYPIGGMLIAMFRNTGIGPVQLNHPFARQIEDVENADGVWVRAVRLYVKVLSQPARWTRRAALAAAERSLMSGGNNPGDAAIANDIRSYLDHHSLHGLRSMEPGGVP